jgi:hypothetical protein
LRNIALDHRSHQVLEKIKTHILCSVTFFFSFENGAVYGIMWKNIVERPGHRLQYGACALNAGYLRLQTHTHIHTHTLCNNRCCCTTTMVPRTRLNVTSTLRVIVVISKCFGCGDVVEKFELKTLNNF